MLVFKVSEDSSLFLQQQTTPPDSLKTECLKNRVQVLKHSAWLGAICLVWERGHPKESTLSKLVLVNYCMDYFKKCALQ